MFGFNKKELFKPDSDGNVPVIVFEGKPGNIPVYYVPAVVGRDKEHVDVLVYDATVSRRHFVIGTYKNKYIVTDQGSTVGTVINGETLEAGVPYYLSEGDKVQIGKLKYTCHINRDKLKSGFGLASLIQKDTARDTSEMERVKPDAEVSADAAPAPEPEVSAAPEPEVDQGVFSDDGISAEAYEEPSEDGEPLIVSYDDVDEEEESAGQEEPQDLADEEEQPGEPEESEEEEDLFSDAAAAPAEEAKKPADATVQVHAGRIKFVYYSGNNAVETFEITGTPFVIGRANGDYAPGAAGVSRRHCFIDRTGKTYYITDLESTNGVWINGRRLKPYNRTAIECGDIIGIGDRVYKVEQD